MKEFSTCENATDGASLEVIQFAGTRGTNVTHFAFN